MIKIGVLIKEFETLENWELRIIENIKNDPDLDLIVVIKDGRDENNHKINNKSLSEFLFKLLVRFEENRYSTNKDTAGKTQILEFLKNISTLELKPRRHGELDVFSKNDSQIIKKYNLDIILKHGFNAIEGEVLSSAKFGVWLLVHGNHSKAGPPGFWEILTQQQGVEVSLVKLTSENKGNLIDKAFYNRHSFSLIETNTKVLESSVSLLFKNIKIQNTSLYTLSKIKSKNEAPNFRNILKYSTIYFKGLFNGFLQKIYDYFGKRSNHWTLFIGEGNFMETDLSKLKPVKVPSDEFWADPFLFKYKEECFVFFENYSYRTKRGNISCGRVENNQLVDIIDVLDFDYHLSYPYIFKEDGEIYMMPETGENERLEIYKCINFPYKWELFTTAFEGENVADAFFYNDIQNQKWLFLNKVTAPYTDRTSELYIYKVDSIKLNSIESHKQNPVIIDARVARNGGAIFENQDKIYRPSQSNTDGVYGKALNINEIRRLTIEEYEEKTIRKVKPDFKNGLVSMHHLHQIDGIFVIDAAFKNKK